MPIPSDRLPELPMTLSSGPRMAPMTYGLSPEGLPMSTMPPVMPQADSGASILQRIILGLNELLGQSPLQGMTPGWAMGQNPINTNTGIDPSIMGSPLQGMTPDWAMGANPINTQSIVNPGVAAAPTPGDPIGLEVTNGLRTPVDQSGGGGDWSGTIMDAVTTGLKFSPLGMLGAGTWGLPAAMQWLDNKAVGAAEGEGAPPLPTPNPNRVPEEVAAPADDDGLSVPFDASTMPQAPVFAPPPSMDPEKLQASKKNSILGAMTQGAAAVDPTSPGSFARALAMAGGGGASAAGDAGARMTEIAHRDALAAYEVANKNAQNKYGTDVEVWKMTLPNIKATDDSVVIQEYDPADKKYKVRVIPTGGILAQADKMQKIAELMEMPGPAAEGAAVSFIAKSYANDPAALNMNLIKMSIERSVENGTGEAIWGEKFAQYYEPAKTEVMASMPGLMTKPAEYRKEISRRVAAKILADQELMSNPAEWLGKAAQYGSVSAQVLVQGGYGKQP